MHRVNTGYLFKVTIYRAKVSSNTSHFLPAGFLEYWPYKVSKIEYGLFSYALQPAKGTSSSFMGAILKEYFVPASGFSPAPAPFPWHKFHSGKLERIVGVHG